MTNILEYLDSSARLFPNKIFLKTPQEEITFKQFREVCQKEASYITKYYQYEKKPILISSTRSIQTVIDMIAVVMSGNYYIPIDLTQPNDRIHSYINISGSSLAIANEFDLKKFQSISSNIQFICNSKIKDTHINYSILDNIRQKSCPADPLYGIFTSGSTGIPKCVLASHNAVMTFINNFTEIFNFTNDTILGNHSTFDFDASVKDIYSAMKTACTVHIFPKNFLLFPIKMIEYINKHNINTAIFSVPVLKFIKKYDLLGQGYIPHSIKKILFSGEVMPSSLLNYWIKYLPTAEYVNLYGPTESTCNCTYWICDREIPNDQPVPIGKKFPHHDIILLNEENELVEGDEIGEICVRGPALALGYLNNKEKTNEVFIQNPLNKEYNDIIYRTGDLGKYHTDGNLLFLGRKDTQIKYNGHRIELCEIELCARQILEVKDVFCFFDQVKDEIILVYSSDIECTEDIIAYMRSKLPSWMIPRKIHHMKDLPINSRLKIDRIAIKKMFLKDI